MGAPSELILGPQAWGEMTRHAVEAFPEECCGVVLQNAANSLEVRRCANIQNTLHELDPETYPRTAATAYAMDPKELESILQEAGRRGARIKALYHSHPDHQAYFSAEDRAFAAPFGEPTFPDAAQIVISVYARVVKRVCAYLWCRDTNDFIEVPVKQN